MDRSRASKKPNHLHAPSYEDLCWRLSVRFRLFLNLLLAEPLTSYNGTIGFCDDTIRFAPVYNVRPGKPRVELPLSNTNFTTLTFPISSFELIDVVLEFVKMMDSVIGHAQGPDLASLLSLDHGSPCTSSSILAAVGCVDQVAASFSFKGEEETVVSYRSM